jgi:Ca2+-binding RTX toxin-like protein
MKWKFFWVSWLMALMSCAVCSVGHAADKVNKKVLTAGPAGDHVEGSPQDEVLVGGPGEDFLYGNGGNDEFRPGSPSGAAAVGGSGNDVYVFKLDDGRLMINDKGGDDEIRLGPGIKPSDVTITAVEGLKILVSGSAQSAPQVMQSDRWSILIMQLNRAAAQSIERIVFADGETWDQAEMHRRARK